MISSLSIYIFIAFATILPLITAECPNACSAHGRCGASDMCTCYRNWMANDCSQRICQFGLAHVDSPKGDLDASGGTLSNSKTVVVEHDQIYPYGTTEQFPQMMNSDGGYLDNTGHEYRECSNKGICDRSTGNCQCFEGYEGSSCQRASCPSNENGICSGHGSCQTIEEIARHDYENTYQLWDATSSMGCACDAGYFGADCSKKSCKYGFDPLYSECHRNVRYSNITYHIYTKSNSAQVSGNYSIIYYDVHDKAWQTDPINWDASCDVVVAALEAIPNNAVKRVICRKMTSSDEVTFSGIYIKSRYTIAFPSSPGRLRQPKINIYLDGKRPTLYTDESTSTLGHHIYANGFIGEYEDHVPTHCSGVLVNLQHFPGYDVLTAATAAQTKLLKSCLGGADGKTSNNVEVYNWDYGDASNPHLVRLIDSTEDNAGVNIIENPALAVYPVSQLCDSTSDYLPDYGYGWCQAKNPPGFYVAMYYNGNDFIVMNRPGVDYDASTSFHLYTTTGYLQVVNNNSRAFTHTESMDASDIIKYGHSNILYMSNTTSLYDDFYGQLDCNSITVGEYQSSTCLNKDDYIMLINEYASASAHASNPVYLNLYQVKKIFRQDRSFAYDPDSVYSELIRHQIHLDYHVNAKYTWAAGPSAGYGDTSARVYKFVLPSATSTTASSSYDYAAPCSNRGICDHDSGTCTCFRGYTSDDCGTQNALAL